MFKLYLGFAITFIGAVMAIVAIFLAWPMVIAIVMGHAEVVQGLGILAFVPIGLALAVLGNRMG